MGWTLTGGLPADGETPALTCDVQVAGVTALLAPPTAALGRIPAALLDLPEPLSPAPAPRGASLVSSVPASRVGLLARLVAPPEPLGRSLRGASFAARATRRLRQTPLPLTLLRDLAAARGLRGPREQALASLERFQLGELARRPLWELAPLDRERLALAAALLGAPEAVVVDATGEAGAGAEALRVAGFEGPILLLADTFEAARVAEGIVVLDRASNDLGTVQTLVPAQSGTPEELAADPRTPFLASERGLNLFSGLGRGGKLSIGHTPITAPTDLEGQVLITLPADAVRVRPEASPEPPGDRNVFRAYVVGTRTRLGRRQVQLSPNDPDRGLAVWGEAEDEVGVGAKVLATVDPTRLSARPFERS